MAILRIEPNIVNSGGDFTFNNVVATSNVTAVNIISSNFYWANGAPFVSSGYSDANVAAYLDSYFTYANANAATQTTAINTLNANVSAANLAISTLQSNVAFQANLIDVLTGNAATQGSILNTLVANAAEQSANLTSLLSNAAAQEASLTSLVNNAASQSGAIDSINANIGAYQTYANANAATQQTAINTVNANIGAYQTWANSTFSVSTYSNSNVSSYLAATYPIVNDGALRLGSGSGPDVYVDALNDVFLGHGGTNYTTVHVDGRAAFSSNATFTANATFSGGANLTINSASNITLKSGSGLHLEAGANIYGGNAYLSGATVTGNITTTGNLVTTNGIFWSNGTRFRPGGTHSTGTAPHSNPSVGDTWYNTTDNIYYQYIDSGESTVWVDFESPILTYNGSSMLYLGSPGNITITGGNTGDLLGTDGAGHLSWNTPYGNTNVASYLQSTGIQNIPIGNATPSTGAYTTLTASGVTTITNASNSTSTTTGALVVSGGIGVTGNVNISGNIQANVNGYSIGYSEIPQISFAANTTLALTDSSKHYYSTSASVLGLTVPTNANVAFNIGTVITVVNAGTGAIKVQPASGVTLYMGGNSTSTTRTIASYGVGTLMKVATNSWFINGAGVS